MIVETVVNLLKAQGDIAAIVEDRIYPYQAPDAATFPLVVVSKPSGGGEYDLEGDIGLEDARVQIDSYDVSYAAVVDLKTAIRRFLSGKPQSTASGDPCAIQGAFCINDVDLTESASERAGPRLRRRMLEFRVWNKEI